MLQGTNIETVTS